MAAKHVGKAILGLVVFPLLADCGAARPAAKPSGKASPTCDLDLKSPATIMKADLRFERKLQERVKGALAAGVRLGELGAKVEEDVTTACSKLAKELGASEKDITPKQSGPGKEAEAACTAAVKMIGKVKKKLGADTTWTAEIEPPACEVPLDAVVDCVAECDTDIKEKDLKADCVGGKASGKCAGSCGGTCTLTKGGPKCEGSCAGSCDGKCDSDIKGSCDGKCEGKCDGKESKAKCDGVCEGKCQGKVKASCSGKCEGSCNARCEMTAKTECPGTCTGECSVDFKEPKCTGTPQLPEAKSECKASCGVKVNQELDCKPAKVVIKLSGNKADTQAATNLKRALEIHVPALAMVALRMQESLSELTSSVAASLKGVQSAVTEGGPAAQKVGGCIATSLESEADAAASIKLSVKASASVTAAAGGD
jgi:hypothetical protein